MEKNFHPRGLKISLCGSHGTGKTTASKILRGIIEKEYPESNTALLGSVTRSVLSWGSGGGSDTSGNSKYMFSQLGDSLQIACIYERRRLMLKDKVLEADFVISERWALDEVSYQLYKSRKTTIGNDAINTLRVCQMEARWEFNNYWDKIYYLPISNFPIEDDGVRPTDVEFQKEIDKSIVKSLKSLNNPTKIITVPALDLNGIKEFFTKEVQSWKIG